MFIRWTIKCLAKKVKNISLFCIYLLWFFQWRIMKLITRKQSKYQNNKNFIIFLLLLIVQKSKLKVSSSIISLDQNGLWNLKHIFKVNTYSDKINHYFNESIMCKSIITILTKLTIARSKCSREGVRNTRHETARALPTFTTVQL